MPVLSFPYGPLEANAHLLHNGSDAIIADPPDNTQEILDVLAAQKLTLRAILCTHLHFDHVSGCAALHEATGLPIFVGKQDWELRDELLGRAMLFGMAPVRPFEGSILEPGTHSWGSLECQVIHTPGHSPGSLCYYFAKEKALLGGDVLFYRSVGRSDLPGGNSQTLFDSIRTRLYTLPADTVVYTGHGMETSIGAEAAHNPFCQA